MLTNGNDSSIRTEPVRSGNTSIRGGSTHEVTFDVSRTLNVYTEVLDWSVRDAVERIGSELFAIVPRPEKADAVPD